MKNTHKTVNLCKELIRVNLPDIKIKNKYLRHLAKSLSAIRYVMCHLSILYQIEFRDYLLLPQLDFVITTKCSLRCKECANLMPYFQPPETYDTVYLKKMLEKLLVYVDGIDELRILGGEPFLHPDLAEILAYAEKQSKINRIAIFTNGTILPQKPELIQILKQPKITIVISDYGQMSRNKDALIKMCEENNIAYYINFIPLWISFGNLDHRKRTTDELRIQFQRCGNVCKTYLEGTLYWCERQASGSKLNFITCLQNEMVDIGNAKQSRDIIRKRIWDFYCNTKYISACLQCDKGTRECKEVPIAEQLRKEEIL